MLAKMIDKIVSLKETKTFEIGGQTYTDGHLTRIPPHVDRPEAVWARVHTAAADQTAAAPADNPATGPEQMTLLGPRGLTGRRETR